MLDGMRGSFSGRGAVALAALVLAAVPSRGQTIRCSVIIRVKPDRVAEFQQALKEEAAALDKAGWKRSRTWWQSVTGPSEYRMGQYYNKYAEMEEQTATQTIPAMAAAFERSRNCIENVETVIEQVMPELSIKRSGAMPPMVRVLRTRVRPDKAAEFMALVNNEVMPGMKKGGAGFYTFSRVSFGPRGQEFTSVMPVNGWADLDQPNPLRKALGEEGFQKLSAKRASIALSSDKEICRYRADLSYIANAGAGGN